MSPEQVKGEPTDARSDLYSVGVSLYEMVTGQRPFVATSDYSIMAAHVKERPKPPAELHPGLPAELNEIILMAIAKDPAQRFQTADAFRNALSSVPVTASPVVAQSALDASTVTSMAPVLTPPATPAVPSRPVSAPAAGLNAAKAPPPVSTPALMPPPPTAGHRGLYMTLGGLIVLAGLVVAGIYVPRSNWTHAKSPDAGTTDARPEDSKAESTASPIPPTWLRLRQPEASPAARVGRRRGGHDECKFDGPARPPTATTGSVDNANAMQAQPMAPAAAAMAKSGSVHHPKKLMAQNNPATGEAAASAQGGEGSTSPGAGDSAQLDELEKAVDQLSNRAAAVNSGLDRLQQEQAASGYGLRGDMVARQASLKSNLFKAEEAIQHRDAARTKKYVDLAAADAEVLERFLGH